MASVNSSLAEETMKLAGSVLPAFSVSEMSFMVNHQSGENVAELKMQPTSAEKLAFEVKSESVFFFCLFFLCQYIVMYLAVGQSERALQLVIFWSTPLLLVVPYDSLTLFFICLSVIIQLAAVYSSCYRLHLKSHPTFVFNKIYYCSLDMSIQNM